MSAEESLELVLRPSWWDDAICAGNDNYSPDDFFWETISYEQIKDHYFVTPKGFKRATKADLAEMRNDMEKQYIEECCDICPVKSECFQAGKYERFGIWGGMNADSRYESLSPMEKNEYMQRNNQ